MSRLPLGWACTRLEDVVEILDSQRIPLNSSERQARIAGKDNATLVPYYGATGQVGLIDSHIFDDDLVLLGEDGVPFFDLFKHKAYRITGKSWVNNHAHVLRARPEVTISGYVEGYLNTFDYTGVVTGSTRLKLTQAAMREIPISIAPLSEQKRISEKLDALLARVDATREHLDRVPALLKRFRRSVLAAATSGELTEEWCVDTQREWEEVTIGDICESSFYGPRFGKDEYTNDEDGIPTVRTTDMTDDGRIEITDDTPRVVVPEDKIDKFAAKLGDLLVTRTGSIGIMAVFDGRFVAIPSAYLIRFRFKESVLPRYAFYCLTAPAGQSAMGLSTTAITQPNINAESIKAISISLPAIDEQREIIRRVEALFALADKVQAQYEAARSRVSKLTSALLAKAFRGELVPQDPQDEPASALLERLQAAKASAQKSMKQRRK
ncbi:TPA: restriction endonuclease subunit S [Stenotrophomonas maltophilia]